MHRMFFACAITAVVTTLVVGGVAWALQSPVDGNGVVHACYSPTNGNMHLNVTGKCPTTGQNTPITWNAQGPQGPSGANGVDGQGVASASLPPGDPNCPNGGSQFAAANGTTYACNGAPGSAGPPQSIALTTGNQQITTTSTTWSDVPGATKTVTVADPQATLLIEMSGVMGCATTSTPDTDGCMMRILVDGQPSLPTLGPEGYFISRVGAYGAEGGARSMRAYATVPTGTHTVDVQWTVEDSPPLNSGTTWFLNYWTLSVEQFATSS